MASETSSAVLDLNDADLGEEEGNEEAPVIMEEGYDIGIKVDAPMKQLSTLETYITYRIRCVCARWTSPPDGVRRRYNHFKVFHKRLTSSHPFTPVPPLPALHSARQQLDRYAPSFVTIRAVALNAFIGRVAKHPILSYSEDFRLFVTTPDDEFDKVFKSESRGFSLWGLSNALYGTNEPKPATNGPRVKDPEFSSMADYLQSLEKKLSSLYSLTNKLFKAHTALAHELDNLPCQCVPWRRVFPPRPPPSVYALPLSALHARTLRDHLHVRDNTHAAYVAGNEGSNELKDRLEQHTESLRAELQDWLPKTRAEAKSTLLDIANKQIETHKNYLLSWERALKLSTEPNIPELFKTVSKNAVQNLSPSKCKVDNDSSLDIDASGDCDTSKCDDFNYLCADNDGINDLGVGDDKVDDFEDRSDSSRLASDKDRESNNEAKINDSKDTLIVDSDIKVKTSDIKVKVDTSDVKVETSDVKVETSDVKVETSDIKVDTRDINVDTSVEKIASSNIIVDTGEIKADCSNIKVDNSDMKVDISDVNGDFSDKKVVSDIVESSEPAVVEKSESNTDLKRNLDMTVVTSDPLQDFADVDLNE